VVRELTSRGYNADREAVTLLAGADDPSAAVERAVDEAPADALTLTVDHVRSVLEDDLTDARTDGASEAADAAADAFSPDAQTPDKSNSTDATSGSTEVETETNHTTETGSPLQNEGGRRHQRND